MAEPTVLLIATYGMEIVECGRAPAKNVRAGGKSFAAVVLAREESRPYIEAAAEVSGVRMQFLNFAAGTVTPDVSSKKILVRVNPRGAAGHRHLPGPRALL